MKETETAEPTVGVEQWIAEARRGSRAALDHLFTAFHPYLLGAAHRALGVALWSRIDAADVVQETLIEAYADFPRFRGRTEKELLAWLRQILHNNLVNEHRRHITTAMRSTRCEVPLTEAALDRLHGRAQSRRQPSSTQAQEQTEILQRALCQLPEHYRQVLLLRTWEELTFAQVGKRLSCSSEAARKLWGRAARELAIVLDNSSSVRKR